MKLALCFALCLVAWASAAVIPLHLPTTVMVSADSYLVPDYLGFYDVRTPVPTTWNLSATYENAGKVYPGSLLMIRNRGPSCITLVTTTPETLEDQPVIGIPPNTSASIISNAPNWFIVSYTLFPVSNQCDS